MGFNSIKTGVHYGGRPSRRRRAWSLWSLCSPPGDPRERVFGRRWPVGAQSGPVSREDQDQIFPKRRWAMSSSPWTTTRQKHAPGNPRGSVPARSRCPWSLGAWAAPPDPQGSPGARFRGHEPVGVHGVSDVVQHFFGKIAIRSFQNSAEAHTLHERRPATNALPRGSQDKPVPRPRHPSQETPTARATPAPVSGDPWGTGGGPTPPPRLQRFPRRRAASSRAAPRARAAEGACQHEQREERRGGGVWGGGGGGGEEDPPFQGGCRLVPGLATSAPLARTWPVLDQPISSGRPDLAGSCPLFLPGRQRTCRSAAVLRRNLASFYFGQPAAPGDLA
eukprot:gene7769-biopygen1532